MRELKKSQINKTVPLLSEHEQQSLPTGGQTVARSPAARHSPAWPSRVFPGGPFFPQPSYGHRRCLVCLCRSTNHAVGFHHGCQRSKTWMLRDARDGEARWQTAFWERSSLGRWLEQRGFYSTFMHEEVLAEAACVRNRFWCVYIRRTSRFTWLLFG